jgi:hypothetical protein
MFDAVPGKNTGVWGLWIGQAHVESGAKSGDLCCAENRLRPGSCHCTLAWRQDPGGESSGRAQQGPQCFLAGR